MSSHFVKSLVAITIIAAHMAGDNQPHSCSADETDYQELLRFVERNEIAHLVTKGMPASVVEARIRAKERFGLFSNGRIAAYVYPTPRENGDTLFVTYRKTGRGGEMKLEKWDIHQDSRHFFFGE